MKRVTTKLLLVAGLGVIAMPAFVFAAGVGAEGWTVVHGQQAPYVNAKEPEIVLQGKLIVENYGKPGVQYFRVPYAYWLETQGRKISLGIHDHVFPPLDKKMVEIKGRLQKAPAGGEHLLVGWIRQLGQAAAPPARGGATNRVNAIPPASAPHGRTQGMDKQAS